MARPLRIEYEGAIYHVTVRGNPDGIGTAPSSATTANASEKAIENEIDQEPEGSNRAF